MTEHQNNQQKNQQKQQQKTEVIFKLFDSTLPAPEQQTAGSVGIDLYSRKELEIAAGEVGYAPLNVALQLPRGYWALLAARSSLHKRGVMLVNGIGVGDWDYRGDGDEYKAALYNFSDETVVIPRGERIVQLIIMPQVAVNLTERESFGDAEDRGGFGSTGS